MMRAWLLPSLVGCVAGVVQLATLTGPSLAEQKSTPKPARQAAQPAPQKLPSLVRDMAEAILGASQSGRLEDLRDPIQWNEIKPDFGSGLPPDPIAALRKTSVDGSGFDHLARLATLMRLPFAVTLTGRDVENNRMFVWPYLAERNLRSLKRREVIDLYRAVPSADAKAMLLSGTYTGYIIEIGADGTWHAYRKRPSNPQPPIQPK